MLKINYHVILSMAFQKKVFSILFWTQDVNNRIGEEIRKTNIRIFFWPARTEEEMNDMEESLSDQENKNLLVNIL